MKVIARITNCYNGRFMLEAGEDEIKEILGDRYASTKIDVGTDIPVGKIYGHLIQMREQRTELEKAARVLRTAAELIEMEIPTATKPMEKEQEGGE